MKSKKTIDEIREDFTRVITFKVVSTIKNHYGTLQAFKESLGDKSNRALKRLITNFHVDSQILHKLTRCNGKRCLDDVLRSLDPNRLVYKWKYTKKYESGKTFSRPSYFYVPFKELERLFSLAGDSQMSPFLTTSKFYTKDQHRYIDKLIFKLGTKERKAYTKSDKFAANLERRKVAAIEHIVAKKENVSESEMETLLEGIDFND